MNCQRIDIRCEGSLPSAYAVFYGYEYSPRLEIVDRPVVIILPGGGYDHTSDREADPVAFKLLSMGYNVAVLRYSVAPAVYPTPVKEVDKLVHIIRDNAEEWHVDTGRVILLGFSAGGHLAALYTIQHKGMIDGLALSYPVITSGEYAHEGSFKHLLGDSYEERKDEFSLEKLVHESMPRTFIWHTFEDMDVPVQNSIYFVNALIDKGVPVEYHLFARGTHGLSLGTKLTSSENDKNVEATVTPWIDLLHTWIGRF
ncbi:MAG: alpha/beta hydrolase [Clostridiales bacterium]|nr:alpha/beta hydrolase [Clostridiales bacterium]